MMAGLDPQVIAAAVFAQTLPTREQRIYDFNHLEPPFPYKVIGLNPATFGLDGLQLVVLPTERRVKV
jgi:hypothetical protein